LLVVTRNNYNDIFTKVHSTIRRRKAKTPKLGDLVFICFGGVLWSADMGIK